MNKEVDYQSLDWSGMRWDLAEQHRVNILKTYALEKWPDGAVGVFLHRDGEVMYLDHFWDSHWRWNFRPFGRMYVGMQSQKYTKEVLTQLSKVVNT